MSEITDPKIIIITGLMASGKSTIAQLLAEKFPKSVHLRGDVFRRMMVNGAVEMGPQYSDEAVQQLHLRYRISAQAALMYSNLGFTVILQDNYYGEALTYIATCLQSRNTFTVVLNPSVDVIKQREAERGKVGYHSFNIEDLYEMFQRTTPRIGHWINNSDQTPEETADEIFGRLTK